MKKTTDSITFVFLAAIFFGCQPKETPPAQPVFVAAAEQAAIIKVNENETACFFKRDYNCWKQNWINEDYACLIWNNSDGSYTAMDGWPAINKTMGDYIREHPVGEGGSSHPDVRRTNYQVKFYGEQAAYLTWDQYNSDSTAVNFNQSKEVRVMEKVGSNWKIVHVSAFWNNPGKIGKDSVDLIVKN